MSDLQQQPENAFAAPKADLGYQNELDVSDIEYAGFWRRTAAHFIDGVIVLIILVPTLFLFFSSNVAQYGDVSAAISILIQYVITPIVVIAFWKKKGGTPGKLLMGVKVVSANTLETASTGRLIIRYLGYIPSSLVLFIGFIWVAFDEKKRGWHDLLAGTVVIKVK